MYLNHHQASSLTLNIKQTISTNNNSLISREGNSTKYQVSSDFIIYELHFPNNNSNILYAILENTLLQHHLSPTYNSSLKCQILNYRTVHSHSNYHSITNSKWLYPSSITNQYSQYLYKYICFHPCIKEYLR